MYTDIESYQIVISLLKKYGIKNLVLSAGTRHTPFVRSVERDSFFKCYSIVDERSAGFFAIGLIEELGEPVVICCTSGTAFSNYLSATSEAFYRNLPLVVISSDRNQYYLNQQEEQMVPQKDTLKSVCKKSVTLPIIKDKNDSWHATNLVNEALLALNHHGKGPVHINVPVEKGLFDFNTPKLPDTRKIERVMPEDEKLWKKMAQSLAGKKILVTVGQGYASDEKNRLFEQFAKKYNAVFMKDHLSNLNCYGAINAYNASRVRYQKLVTELVPDILICMGGNAVEIRGWLVNLSGKYEFWNVVKSGEIKDPFRCLNAIFECDEIEFVEKMLSYAPEKENKGDYFAQWQNVVSEIVLPEFEYSDIYAVEEFMKKIPEGALLHLANSNSVRFPQMFELSPSIKVSCNRGASGIDGSMSTFIGQSSVHDGLCFLLIGDLSFFYDMNALWNKYVGKNVRIMLNNNSCGEIFFMNKLQDKKLVGLHTAAEHTTSAKAWVESRGFKYLSATSREEFDVAIKEFLSEDAEGPIFFEVMTDKNVNDKEMDKFLAANVQKTFKSTVKGAIKSMIGR